MRQGAPDGNIHKKQPQRCIHQGLLRLEVVKLLAQDQGADRHGGRFRNQGAEQGGKGHHGNPPGPGRRFSKFGAVVDYGFRQLEDGAGRGDDHDNHHEHGLREGAVVIQVGREVLKGIILPAHEHEGDDPDAEHGFHFPQEMEDGGREGDRKTLLRVHHAEVGFLELFLVAQGQLVGIAFKPPGQERMDNSPQEHERHGQVEPAGLLVALREHLGQAGIRRRGLVLVQGNGKMAVL